MNWRECQTQKEVDAAISAGEGVVVRGAAQVRAYDSAQVDASDSAQVTAYDSAQVTAYDSAQVTAYDSAQVWASDSAQVRAYGSAQVRAYGSAQVTAHGRASVIRFSPSAICRGNVLDLTVWPKTTEEWLTRYSIRTVDGKVVLYKGLNQDWRSPHGLGYKPDTTVTAPDWVDDGRECGAGLHFCWCPSACDQFNVDYKPFSHYVACKVAVADIRVYRNDGVQFPDKVRARTCKVLYEVDREGKRVSKKGVK